MPINSYLLEGRNAPCGHIRPTGRWMLTENGEMKIEFASYKREPIFTLTGFLTFKRRMKIKETLMRRVFLDEEDIVFVTLFDENSHDKPNPYAF